MTATGSHEYFYSLCGAQPPGEGYPQKNRHSYVSGECFFASPGNSALSYPKFSAIPRNMHENPPFGGFSFLDSYCIMEEKIQEVRLCPHLLFI